MSVDPRSAFWWTLAGTLALGWGWTIVQSLRNRRRRARSRERHLEGLRYLLDDKPDRALEVFLSLSASDDETMDTHFALGSLYRRRGEVDRAIKVHEHIVARKGIDRRHRDAARLELARDYFRAGLYDRAEQLFNELAADARDSATALAYLVRIYERQRDWTLAAETHLRLQAAGGAQSRARSHLFVSSPKSHSRRPDRGAATAREGHATQPDFGRAAILRGTSACRTIRHSRSVSTAASCGEISTCCRWCCRGSPGAPPAPAIPRAGGFSMSSPVRR
jgi:lipopolysaccharide biosynthesis regulator YciM